MVIVHRVKAAAGAITAETGSRALPRGIRTKAVARLDGRVRGGIRFGVGPMAHLLKNRFYIGEVVYRGEVHAGEHEAILDRNLFEAVRAKLAANAVVRNVRLRGSASILTGRIFDDRGNRMSPTHSNKLGVMRRTLLLISSSGRRITTAIRRLLDQALPLVDAKLRKKPKEAK